MPIDLSEENGGKTLAIHVTGKASKVDFDHFVPEFERFASLHGKLRVLFDLTGFHGWEAGALWDEIQFDIKHYADIERLAVVGIGSGSRAWRRSSSRLRRRRADTLITPTPPKRGSGWTKRRGPRRDRRKRMREH